MLAVRRRRWHCAAAGHHPALGSGMTRRAPLKQEWLQTFFIFCEAAQKATEIALGRAWKLQRVIDAVKARDPSGLLQTQLRL